MSNLRQRADGRWAEDLPTRCPEHGGRYLVGWESCRCGGHRTLTCVQCPKPVAIPEQGESCRPARVAAPDEGRGG
jgi:hypothetical protein